MALEQRLFSSLVLWVEGIFGWSCRMCGIGESNNGEIHCGKLKVICKRRSRIIEAFVYAIGTRPRPWKSPLALKDICKQLRIWYGFRVNGGLCEHGRGWIMRHRSC